MLFLHQGVEILSDHLFTLGTELIDEISAGTVGEATAIEFMGYLQNGLDEKRAQKILDDPENAEIPDDLGNLYALASHICSRASEKRFVPEQADYSSDSRRKSRFL